MKYHFGILLLTFLFSCNTQNSKQLLEDANRFIDNKPDSTLILLEKIKRNHISAPEDFAKYGLAYIKAKDKCYMDLAEDTTTALQIINYYKDKTNTPNKGWAYYYAGRVFHDANKEPEASEYYIEAADYAEKTSNYELGSMSNYYLAEFHATQFMFDKAIAAYKKALSYCLRTKEKKFESLYLSSVGYVFGQMNQIDSALYYLKKAYIVASDQRDTIQIANISNDLSVFLYESHQFEKSKKYIEQSIKLHSDSLILPQYILLADIFLNMNKTDSALLILKQIEGNILTSTDINNKAIYYETLSNIEESKENYSTSLDYYKIYTKYLDSIYTIKKEASLAEIEQKYNYIKTNDYNLKLKTERNATIFITILLLTLLLLFYYSLQKRLKHKKNALYEAEEKLNTMQSLLNKSSKQKEISENTNNLNDEEKECLLKSILLKQLNISTKIALMHAQNPDKNQSFLSKFNEIMYGEQRSFQLNWEELYPIFNILYKDFVKTLRTKFPILVEKDIQLCCLLLIDLNTAEITFLMNQSINTVHKRKTEIRKKLNMQAGTDIASFLKESTLI